MKSRTRPYLGLEKLEDRWVPASVRFDGSNLFVYNLFPRAGGTSSVTLNEAAAGNTFQVLDGAANNGSFAVSGNITIQGNNLRDMVNVNLNAMTGLTGNLNVSTGNGVASVTVDGLAGATGLMVGNTQITLGFGGGTVNLGTANGLSDRGNVTVGSGGTANNTVNLGTAARVSTFAGTNLTFSNFNNVTLGAGSADSFRGNVNISDPNNPNAGTVTLGKTASVLGNFNVNGGTGNETVNINGAAVNGALSLHLQNGTNALVFGSGGPTTVGSLSFTSGNGNTSFTNAAGTTTTVLNNATLNWGNGANSFGATAGFGVNGAFNVTNGNGGVNVVTNTFRATVGGALTINTGNGANLFTLDGTNGASVAGTFNYTGGTGGNSITVDNASNNLVNLNVFMGEGSPGNDLFTISAATFGGTITGAITWAVPTAANAGNAFVPNTYVFTNFISLTNVPS
jgi:hypothetical protein